MTNRSQLVPGEMLSLTLTGLNAFTRYSVSISAFTVAIGPESSPISVTTDEDVPSQPPTNLTVTPIDPCFNVELNCGLSKLHVEWDPPPAEDRNGIIILYEIYYVGAEFDTDLHTANVSGDVLSLNLTELEEYVIYDVRIRAFTHVGPSSFSLVQSVRTYAAPPESPLVSIQNLTLNSSIDDGLASLKLTWVLSPRDVNGLLVGFEVNYYCSSSQDWTTHTLIRCTCNYAVGMEFVENRRGFVFNDLTSYSWYDVIVLVVTTTEPGGSLMKSDYYDNYHIVLTAEDRPSSAPQNLFVAASYGREGLFITWDELPCTQVNGLLQKYVIYYQRENMSSSVSISISPSSNKYTLLNLESFTEYSVWMQAFTGAGGGPFTEVVRKRTDGIRFPPINVTAVVVSPFSVYVTWDLPLKRPRDDFLDGYNVVYSSIDGIFSNGSIFLANGSTLETTIENLKPFRRYAFSVAIKVTRLENVEWSSFSKTVIVRTKPSRPSTPARIVRVLLVGLTFAVIEWDEPDPDGINGILTDYKVELKDEANNRTFINHVGDNGTRLNFTNLLPHREYDVRVFVINTEGEGPPSNETVKFRTDDAPPDFSPQNITATVLSSTAVLVTWSISGDSGILGILNGYNIYYRADGESLRRQYDVDDIDAHNATLTGLRPYTYYTITMDAATEEGLSPEGPDPPLRVRTEEDVPKAPRLLSVSRYRNYASPAYLIVRWETLSVADRNGVITAYEINYVGDEFDTDPHSVHASGIVTSLTLSGLEEYVVYDVKIRAYTSVGPGPFSAILSARTYGARPASPVILSIQNVSSSSSIDGLAGLKVTWSNPPPRDFNGLFVGINIEFHCSSHGYFRSNLFSSYEEAHIQMMCDCDYHYEMDFLKNGTEFVITNLTSYSWYDVIVHAVSQDGRGGRRYYSDWNPTIVLTAEDRPTGAPVNLSVVGIIGRPELLLTWTEMLCTRINGVLEKYVIYYRRETGPAAPSDVQNVTASPRSTMYTLSNLESFGEYSVWMQAFTGAGGGPLTPIVRARTTEVCECYLPGSVSENCNLTTGQCSCRYGAERQHCDTCILSQKPFADISECLVFQNITATVLSSIAILVEWSPLNNFNVSGYNIYYRADGESLRRRYDVDDIDAHNATLTGLRPYTYYTITMDAATSEGLSPEGPDPPLRVRTEDGVPIAAPRLLSVSRYRDYASPAYLIVRWATLSVADLNGVKITAYEINYVGDEFDTDQHSVNVSGSVTSLTLSGLEEYVVYDVKVRAYTSISPGPFSAILSARTYPARPASPVILSIQNVSSSSSIDDLAGLKVTWSNPPPRDVNGLFMGIDVQYQCSSNGYYNSFSHEEAHIQMTCGCDYHHKGYFLKNRTEFVITNLTSYSWYDIFVFAVSQDGPGGRKYYSDWNPNIVLTAQDRPTGVPRNLSVVGTVGRKKLLVSWIELLCTLINGLLEKYVIYYQRESGPAVPSDVQNVTASPSSTNYTLSNLESFVEYSVWMQAFTGAGGGPLTPVVKARTTRVCECYLPGSVSENCNLTTGQCLCRDGADGQKCDTCILSQKPFANITECLETIDNTPFNCLDPPRRWPNQCNDVALPSRPPARLHVSATVLSGDSALRDHVSVYWNGWTCFFTCPLTYSWKVYILVRRDSFLVMPRFSQSHRIDHQPVRYPIFIHPLSGMNLLELTVAHGSHTSIVRSLILVDTVEGSSVALSTRHKLQFASAKYKNWQTDQRRQDLSVSWENHFYNTYIKKSPSLLFPIERPQFGYDVVTPPLSFSGIQTFNNSGIMSFGLSLYQKNATYKRLIASQNFTALEQNWVYRHPKPFESGETYEVEMTAKDIFGHHAFSSALVYTDFTPPSITDVILWKREQSPIRDLDLCSEGRTGSVFTLELRAMDKESGIETIEWTISKTKSSTTSEGRGTITSQIQSQCLDRDESCYCATDGVCVLKTFTSGLQGLETLLNSNTFYLTIRANSRSGLTSTPWEKKNPLPKKAGISPTLESLTPASRTMRVKWSLGGSPTRFLVIACRKDLITEECVTCLEVSVDGSQHEVEVENLKPVTNYRVQIEAFDGDNSGLSAADEAKTQEDSPDGSPIDIAVTTLPNKEALFLWKPPNLFEQNGKITNYKVAVEIEDSLGQWVLAQAEIATVAPQTNASVKNLFSGRKYRIRVSAATAIGFGPPSDPYDFTTPEDVPDEPPANVSLAHATKSSVRISWEAIPSGSRNGILRDYVVTYVAQKGGEAEKTVTVRGTETSATLSGLLPYTFYIVKVSGRTNKGLGPVSDDLIVRTSEDVPGPPSLGRADPVSSTAISLSWTAPSEPRGDILDYRIFVFTSSNRRRRDLASLVSVANLTAQKDESNIIITNLTEGTNYSIYMRARTSQGLGEQTALAHVVTLKQIPGAPRGLTARSGTPESISVSWLAPSAGKISPYVIVYSADDQEGKKLNATTRDESYVLDRLSPYTYYRIEVKAEGGNASSVTFAYTLEGTPGPLGSFRIPNVGASSVLLEWEPPRSPNGRIAYSYRITETATGWTKDVDLRPDELGVPDCRFFRWRVADLTGYTEYQLSMRAFNILYDHRGPTSDLLVIRTNQGKPGPPDAVQVDATRRASLLVSWSPPKKPNGIITEYEITTQWANATGTPKIFTIIHQNNPTARFQEVEGLEHPAQYSVIIRAKTISGEGAGSKPILMFTKFVDPDDRTPRNVTHWDLTSTSVTLNWERPLHPNLLNYTLTVRIDGSIPFIRRVINANETSEGVEGLMPYTLFSATLVAGYVDGSLGDVSDPQYFQTPPSAPSSAPRNFTVSQTNESSTLLLSWISPLESDLNGVLCGFVARYWPLNSPDSKLSKTDFDAGDHEALLTELTPYTVYHVEIAAETCSVDAEGPFASGKNRTGEGVPDKPNIAVVGKNSTWVKLSWTVEPNGILFRVEANISSDQGHVYKTTNVTGEAEFFGLEPYHRYTVRIRAHSGRGAGAFGTRNVSTCAAAPLSSAVIHTCEALQGNQDKVKAIRLNYTDVSMPDWRGERQGYRVNLFKGNETGIGQVFSDTKYVGQSVGGSDTLEVDESTIDFDQWYTVTMEAESRADCGQTTVGPSSDPCQFLIPSTSEPRGSDDMSMVIAVAVSVAVLVLIVLVIVMICVRKRRRQANLEVIQLKDPYLDMSGGNVSSTIPTSGPVAEHAFENPSFTGGVSSEPTIYL
ncbi:usherin-like isoform X2 [Oscarella lobularis]